MSSQIVVMCAAGGIEEVIILSDDEDDKDLSCLVVEVEDVKKTDSAAPPNTLEDDLVVTFYRRADVLPHARYDCPVHPFTAAVYETSAPVDSNHLICDQCFCYICDKLASSCVNWRRSGTCHCNGHQKSDFWKNLRNFALLGELKAFNLTLSEIDPHLRQAEMMLHQFRQELPAMFSSYMLGQALPQEHSSQQLSHIYNYTPVFEYVSSFLDKADKQDSRAAAIMNLGAAENFVMHFPVSGPTLLSPMANANEAKMVLLQRVISSVQKQMVLGDLTSEFTLKLQEFYQKRIHFSAEIKSWRSSLCVRPWDDVLLVSVLRGQNVSGVRKDKGKKDVLIEEFSVVLLRSELLQRQCRYRELSRYLRVVQTTADSRYLQKMQDLIPFFLCLEGVFTSAISSLFSLVSGPASRLTPQLFLLYLRIFKSATAPKVTVSQPEQLCSSDAAWEPIKDAAPLKHAELVKFALRAQRCSSAVYTDPQCWSSLLTIVNSPCDSLAALAVPSPQFIHDAQSVVESILLDQQGSNMHIPRSFQEEYPDQALLLLVTGALGFRILNAPLDPVLPVTNTFKENLWAFQWLCDFLFLRNKERLKSFMEVTKEKKTGSPLDFKLDSSQEKTPSHIQLEWSVS